MQPSVNPQYSACIVYRCRESLRIRIGFAGAHGPCTSPASTTFASRAAHANLAIRARTAGAQSIVWPERTMAPSCSRSMRAALILGRLAPSSSAISPWEMPSVARRLAGEEPFAPGCSWLRRKRASRASIGSKAMSSR